MGLAQKLEDPTSQGSTYTILFIVSIEKDTLSKFVHVEQLAKALLCHTHSSPVPVKLDRIIIDGSRECSARTTRNICHPIGVTKPIIKPLNLRLVGRRAVETSPSICL